MLRLDNVSAFYGYIQALRDVSIHVNSGEVVTIIGANGSGKTTLLRTISGVIRPRQGNIIFNGMDLARVPPKSIVEAGVAHVPEGRQVFSSLTVQENLEMGAYSRRRSISRGELEEDYERIFAMFPVLRQRLRQKAGTLSGGEQQMLAIGRALLAKPKLLLLDEPSMGLAPKLTEMIFNVLQQLNSAGLTILLVEQSATLALSVAHRGYVLANGKIILEDSAANLAANDDVRQIYFGKRTVSGREGA